MPDKTSSETRTRSKQSIFDFLDGQSQPLTASEVCAGTGIEISEVRKALAEMVTEDLCNARLETTDERIIRFGGFARAARANMYSITTPVPPRTARTAVEGVTATPMNNEHTTPSRVVRQSIADSLRTLGRRRTFTIQSLAGMGGLNEATVTTYVRGMREEGIIRAIDTKSRNTTFRVDDVAKAYEFLRAEMPLSPDPAVIRKVAAASAAVAESGAAAAREAHSSPTQVGGLEPLADLLAERERLSARMIEIAEQLNQYRALLS